MCECVFYVRVGAFATGDFCYFAAFAQFSSGRGRCDASINLSASTIHPPPSPVDGVSSIRSERCVRVRASVCGGVGGINIIVGKEVVVRACVQVQIRIRLRMPLFISLHSQSSRYNAKRELKRNEEIKLYKHLI